MSARPLPPLHLLALYLPAAAAGALLQWLNFPLPWLIGPLVLVATLYASGTLSATIASTSRFGGQMIVGLQIGVYFTADAMQGLLALLPLLLGVSILTLGVAALVSLVAARIGGRPLAPTFLATLPFSPVEATVLTQHYGWSPGPVVLAQTLRIGVAVTTVPVLLYLIDGWPAPSGHQGLAGGFDPLQILILAGIGIASALIFRVLGLTNPFFMGPLLVSAVAATLGLGSPGFPFAIVAAAQLVLGVWLGSAFRRAVFLEAREQLVPILLTTTAFLGLVAAGAVALALAFGQPWRVVLLGAIPGGVTEMALTAKFLGVDVALVTGLQMTRILLIILTMRLMLGVLRRIDERHPPR